MIFAVLILFSYNPIFGQGEAAVPFLLLHQFQLTTQPGEYLNCDLKYGLSQKVRPKNDEQLKNNVQSHMKLLQRKPDGVVKYFKHKCIKYAV